MKRALECARKARCVAPPHPWVGCVIAKEGTVLSSGWTEPPGGEHAELVAIKKASGIDLQGATLYLTLEPCCHRGRTPPCIDAITASGVKQVVIGITDPDPNVRGKGVKQLQRAGIEVQTGLLKEEIEEELVSYLHYMRKNSSYTVLKTVQSVDGTIRTANPSALSIIDHEAEEDAHRLRNHSQAVLIGAKTVLQDNPHLTVRHTPLKGPPPLRVVIDSHDTIPLNANIFKTDVAPTLCITSGKKERNELLLSKGVDTLSWNSPKAVSCSFIQKELAQRKILQLLVEGGAMTLSHFLQEQAFHELIVYIGPKILGKEGARFSEGVQLSSFTESPVLRLVNSCQLGNSVRLTYRVSSST